MMEIWLEVTKVLNVLGYYINVEAQEKCYDIWFYLEDREKFPDRHIKTIEALAGESLLEMYWESSVQHIYVRK